MKGLINVNAYVEGVGITKTDISFNNGIIKDIDENLAIENIVDIPNNSVVLPGFIDEHIHGAGGFDTMDGTLDALDTISKTLVKEGTTSFLATTMTQSEENIENALINIKDYITSQSDEGATLLGVNLEGPFISENYIGAQPLKYLLDPNIKIFDKFYKASGENIKLTTVAPEEKDGLNFISHIISKGVNVAIGHSDANIEIVQKAISKGANTITHLFNAQRGIHHRELGVAGSGLLFDELYTETIADLIHLSKYTLMLIAKTKSKDKIILITDSMRAKGLNDGVSELGGQKVIVKNGEARLTNGHLAGSILKMNDAIKNMVLKVGVPFLNAVDFATINPAKNLGVNDKIGSIKKGKLANLTVIDDEFNVLYTFIKGNLVYKK